MLTELLAVISSPLYDKCKLILDIKEDNPICILTKLQEVLFTSDYSARIIIGVWNLKYLEEASRLFSKFKIMLIHEAWPPRSTPALPLPKCPLESTLIDIFSVNWESLKASTIAIVKYSRPINKMVFAWVLNSKEDIQAAKAAGIDAIITDNPELSEFC